MNLPVNESSQIKRDHKDKRPAKKYIIKSPPLKNPQLIHAREPHI